MTRPEDRTEVEDALHLLLLTMCGFFNRTEDTLPADVRDRALAAMRKAHEALDAAEDTPPSFPYARFPAGRLLALPRR